MRRAPNTLHLGVREAFFLRGEPSRRRATSVSSRLRRRAAAGRGRSPRGGSLRAGKKRDCGARESAIGAPLESPDARGSSPRRYSRGARRRRADPPSARRFGGGPRGRLSECPFCARNERVESGVSRSSTGRARADVRGALRRARAETETGGGSGGGERNLRVRTESEGRESAPRARPAAGGGGGGVRPSDARAGRSSVVCASVSTRTRPTTRTRRSAPAPLEADPRAAARARANRRPPSAGRRSKRTL